MKLKVAFDKDTKDESLHTGWGVSFLINERILFDTGENGSWLMENIKRLKIDIEKIETIVISHNHWDHTGGLWELLKNKKGAKIYICSDFGAEFQDKVRNSGSESVEITEVTEITNGIFTTGGIKGEYKGKDILEQSLAMRTGNGISIITGCAHPGIIRIIEKVKEHFPGENIYMVIGGFHLMDKDKRTIKFIVGEFRRLGVKKAAPTHCAGYDAKEAFKNEYKDDFISVNVGETIDF